MSENKISWMAFQTGAVPRKVFPLRPDLQVLKAGSAADVTWEAFPFNIRLISRLQVTFKKGMETVCGNQLKGSSKRHRRASILQ